MMNTPFPNRVRNLTVNDLSTDPEILAALAAYDARVREANAQMSAYDFHGRGWDKLVGDVTPVEDGAHAVADLGSANLTQVSSGLVDAGDDLAEHDSNGEA